MSGTTHKMTNRLVSKLEKLYVISDDEEYTSESSDDYTPNKIHMDQPQPGPIEPYRPPDSFDSNNAGPSNGQSQQQTYSRPFSDRESRRNRNYSRSNFSQEYTRTVDPYPGILDLDCSVNPDKEFDQWLSTVTYEVHSKGFSGPQLTNYVTGSTAGAVRKYLTREDVKTFLNAQEGLTPEKQLSAIESIIAEQFLGQRQTPENQREVEREAVWHLTHLQICDLCMLEEFNCEYRKYFFRLKKEDQEFWLKQYFEKLPTSQLHNHETEYQTWLARQGTHPAGLENDTIGKRMRYIRLSLAAACEQREKQKQTRGFAICCNNSANSEFPGNYGCGHSSSHRRKKKKKFKKRHKYKNKFSRRKRRHFNRAPPRQRPRFFRKRRKPSNKQKYCPKGSTACKCWVCNEQGHYANECPNKKKKDFKEKNKILEQILKLKYEPIEDSDISETESLYYLESDYESESETETETESETSSSSDSSETEEEKQLDRYNSKRSCKRRN